jgi:hypothetical protein
MSRHVLSRGQSLPVPPSSNDFPVLLRVAGYKNMHCPFCTLLPGIFLPDKHHCGSEHWINEMLSSERLHIHTPVHVIFRACVNLCEIWGRSGKCVQLQNVFPVEDLCNTGEIHVLLMQHMTLM